MPLFFFIGGIELYHMKFQDVVYFSSPAFSDVLGLSFPGLEAMLQYPLFSKQKIQKSSFFFLSLLSTFLAFSISDLSLPRVHGVYSYF